MTVQNVKNFLSYLTQVYGTEAETPLQRVNQDLKKQVGKLEHLVNIALERVIVICSTKLLPLLRESDSIAIDESNSRKITDVNKMLENVVQFFENINYLLQTKYEAAKQKADSLGREVQQDQRIRPDFASALKTLKLIKQHETLLNEYALKAKLVQTQANAFVHLVYFCADKHSDQLTLLDDAKLLEEMMFDKSHTQEIFEIFQRVLIISLQKALSNRPVDLQYFEKVTDFLNEQKTLTEEYRNSLQTTKTDDEATELINAESRLKLVSEQVSKAEGLKQQANRTPSFPPGRLVPPTPLKPPKTEPPSIARQHSKVTFTQNISNIEEKESTLLDKLWNHLRKYSSFVDVANFIVRDEQSDFSKLGEYPCFVLKSDTWQTEHDTLLLQLMIQQAWDTSNTIDMLVVSPLQYENGVIKQQAFSEPKQQYEYTYNVRLEPLFKPILLLGPTFTRQPTSMNEVLINEPLLDKSKIFVDDVVRLFQKGHRPVRVEQYKQYRPMHNLTKEQKESVHDLRGIDDYIIYLGTTEFGGGQHVETQDKRIFAQTNFTNACLLNMLTFSNIDVHTIAKGANIQRIPGPTKLWEPNFYTRTPVDKVFNPDGVVVNLATRFEMLRGIFRGTQGLSFAFARLFHCDQINVQAPKGRPS